MKRLGVALLFSLLIGAASAQLSGGLMFPGPGTPHSAGGGGYVGLGNVSVSATIKMYAGTRCYTATYSGNVADIVDASTGNTTGTRLKCDGAGNVISLVSGSACTFVTGNACSALATTCSSTCLVITLYDQSGLTNCGGVACDFTMASNNERPIFVSAAQNGYGALRTNSTFGKGLETANAMTTLAQPLSLSVVGGKNTPTNSDCYVCAGINDIGLVGTSSANTVFLLSSTVASVTASNAAYHSFEGVINGASSSLLVDTTANTPLSITAGHAFSGQKLDTLSNAPGAGNTTMDILEIALFSGSFSSGDQNALEANQHGTSGYNF